MSPRRGTILSLQTPHVRRKDTVSLTYDGVTFSDEISSEQESTGHQQALNPPRTYKKYNLSQGI